jgi:endoglucanase
MMIRNAVIYFFFTCMLLSNLLLPTALWAQKKENDGRLVLKRGINISHWLSQSRHFGRDRATFFTEKDVIFLKQHGFDHIRLPVDEDQLWEQDHSKKRASFELLHQAMQWCYLHHLNVVLDLHILRSHYFDASVKPLWTQPQAQDWFLECWRQLSAEMKRYPVSMLAYELLNEPVADSAAQWNELLARGIAVIRETEPKRMIVIGSNRWQSVTTFPELKVPEADPNIILSFHYYNPFVLTHHMAGWTRIRDYTGPVHYPGATVTAKELDALPATIRNLLYGANKVYNTDTIQAQLQPAIRLSQRLDMPLYCGEWGCMNTVPHKDRLRWYKDVRKVLERNNIAWSTWDYKSNNFGLVGEGLDAEPDKDLLKALTK